MYSMYAAEMLLKVAHQIVVPCPGLGPTATLPRFRFVATYLLLLETLLLLVVVEWGLLGCRVLRGSRVQFASVAIRERNFRHFQVIGVAFILIIFTCCHRERGRKGGEGVEAGVERRRVKRE